MTTDNIAGAIRYLADTQAAGFKDVAAQLADLSSAVEDFTQEFGMKDATSSEIMGAGQEVGRVADAIRDVGGVIERYNNDN